MFFVPPTRRLWPASPAYLASGGLLRPPQPCPALPGLASRNRLFLLTRSSSSSGRPHFSRAPLPHPDRKWGLREGRKEWGGGRPGLDARRGKRRLPGARACCQLEEEEWGRGTQGRGYREGKRVERHRSIDNRVWGERPMRR